MSQSYLKKEKFRDIMRKEKLLLQVRSTTANLLSQQKYYIEMFQAMSMEILLLKALR